MLGLIISIINYVDEDPSGAILDYNCNNRTYNGHKGTDIFIWPFPWQKMSLNAVQIVAAAPGTIIGNLMAIAIPVVHSAALVTGMPFI